MNMIYNSPSYCVVEFRDTAGEIGGYEIMDKHGRKEIYLDGDLAVNFRDDVQELIEREPSVEEVDDFLSRFQGLMLTPVVLH